MKTIFFTLTSLLLTLQLSAQQPLLRQDFPQVGTQDSLFVLGTTALNLNLESDTGQAQIWDFSAVGIPAFSAPGQLSFSVPQPLIQQDYPQATLQEKLLVFGDSAHQLYRWHGDSLFLIKQQSQPQLPQPQVSYAFPKGHKVAVFPWAFRQMFTSDWTIDDSLSLVARKSIWRYDGYGQVINPLGDTLGPAARIRQLRIDSSLVTVGAVDTSIGYLWLGMGTRKIVAQLTPVNPGEFRMAFNTESRNTVSLAEIDRRDIGLYPNPTTGRVIFSQPVQKMTVLNLLGQNVLQREVAQPVVEWNLPAALPNGVYLLLLESEESTWTSRLQVLR